MTDVDCRGNLEEKLRRELAASHVEVIDDSHLHAGHAGARDGKGHFRAIIVSDRFEGLRPVAAQRLVFQVLAEEMRETIHALSLKTYTPEAWAAEKGAAG